MNDLALERSRRYAWARYYRERDRAERLELWAGELAEWLEALVDDLPDPAASLARIAQDELTPHQTDSIRAYVARNAPAWRAAG